MAWTGPLEKKNDKVVAWLLLAAVAVCSAASVLVARTYFQDADGDTNYILGAIPFFLLLIGVEQLLMPLVKKLPRAAEYSLADTWGSLAAGSAQRIWLVLNSITIEKYLAQYIGYVWIRENLNVWDIDDSNPLAWVAVLFVADFKYYWMHRFGHTNSLLWVGHQVHHSSEHYNLSTALRQSWVQGAWDFLAMLPFAFFVPAHMWFAADSWNTLYQFWVHTCLIDRLGAFEWVFATPSHHRVHHDRRVHKNFGGIFIIWDRMFGTFLDEYDSIRATGHSRDDEEIMLYGVTNAVETWAEPIFQHTGFQQVFRKIGRAFSRSRGRGDSVLATAVTVAKAMTQGPGYSTTLAPRTLRPPQHEATRLRVSRPVSSVAGQIFMNLQIVENFCVTIICLVGLGKGMDIKYVVVAGVWFYFNGMVTTFFLDRKASLFHYLHPLKVVAAVAFVIPLVARHFIASVTSDAADEEGRDAATCYFTAAWIGVQLIELICQLSGSLTADV